jgi:hypothetical protein
MSTDPSAAIVIVNWNGRRLLETCLPAALAQTHADYAVIVVDNGSSDDSLAWLAARYPGVRVIANRENTGFCAGNNQAFAAVSSPYLALLNNDAAPEPGWLAAMIEVMESDASVGMIAPKVLRWDDHSIIDSQGLAVDRSGTAWDWGSGERDDPAEPPAPRPVFGASGAACLYRRAMLDDIGGLDEDFFAYLEDADLAWRARLAGWRCLYVPTARVYHRHSATGGEGSPFKGFHLGRNKWWMIVKNYPMPEMLLNLPIILGRDVLAVLYHLIVRHDVHPLRGRLAALRSLGTALRKRPAVQRRATAQGKREAWALRRGLGAGSSLPRSPVR